MLKLAEDTAPGYQIILCKGSRKKKFFRSGRAAKRGGGLNECVTKEKIFFLM